MLKAVLCAGVFCVLSGAFVGSAWADDDHQKLAEPVASVPPSPSAAADNKTQVCHQLPAPTGTRLGVRRECHTQAQWDEIQKRSQKAIEDIQTRGGQAGKVGG